MQPIVSAHQFAATGKTRMPLARIPASSIAVVLGYTCHSNRFFLRVITFLAARVRAGHPGLNVRPALFVSQLTHTQSLWSLHPVARSRSHFSKSLDGDAGAVGKQLW